MTTAFLALPAPGDKGLATIHRKLRLFALRSLLTRPSSDLDEPWGRALRGLQASLTGLLKSRPKPLLRAVGHPDVLGPLLVMHGGHAPAADMLGRAVPSLLARLAGADLPEAILWDAPITRLVDAEHDRVIELDPPARAMIADAAGMEIEVERGRRVDPQELSPRHPFHRITPTLHLSEVDTNPLSMWEEHPDKDGNAIDLGGRGPEEWVAALQEALALVEQALPTWHAELPLALRRLVPVGFEPERHLSASYREFPGLAYLTLHPDPLTLAEAIVHETQHGKINALSWLDGVLHNAWTEWTESPVRPDLRPLWGVLLAVHAFVPVAALHARLADAEHPLTRTDRFPRRRAEVLAGNARGLRILQDKARPTKLGSRVLGDLVALHAGLADAAPPAPPGIDDEALPPG